MLSPPDEDVVQRDQALPGLAMLLDTCAMQEALSEHLARLGISQLQSHYVRYKPGIKCLAAYRGRAAGEEVQLYAKAYPASHRHRLEQLRERIEQSNHCDGAVRTRWAIPGAAVTTHLFPFDKEIPALPQLAEPQARSRLLERVLMKDAPHLAARASQFVVRPLAYKPERRFVAALMDDQQPIAVLKLHSDAAFERVSKSARRIGAHGAGGMLRVPRRMGRSRQYRALAIEWLDGQLLAEAVQSPDFPSEEMRRVGTALAELHGRKIRKLLKVGVPRLVGLLHELADSVSHLAPALSSRLRSLTSVVTRHLSACHDDPVAIHADFYTKQVVLQEESVGFIDFDEAALGSRSADLGNFMAHLEWDVIRGRVWPQRAASIRDTLLQAYAESGSPLPPPEALAAYTAAGLLRLVPHPFRNREPQWPRQMELLLDRVEAALDSESYLRVVV